MGGMLLDLDKTKAAGERGGVYRARVHNLC